MSTLATSIKCGTGSTVQRNQARKNKRHPNWKWRSKTVIVLRWHIGNLKDSIKKLLGQLNKLSKVIGYKIDTQISVGCL